MSKVAKSYRNQWIDQQSPRFKRIYEYQIAAVDEMLRTGKPVEVKFRDWRALERFRRKVYELSNAMGMRITTKKLDPYTLMVDLPEDEAGIQDEITIGGKPLEKVRPVAGVDLRGEVELTPEQEALVAEAMEKYKKDDQKELDTEDFVNKVFGKEGSQDVEGDKP